MPDSNAVDHRTAAYMKMSPDWALIDTLMGGTAAMRDAGTTYLPKEDKEKDKSYEVRLSRSYLFGGLAKAIDDMASRPFAKPVTLQGELPESLDDMEDNVDLQGRNLTQFAGDMFEMGLKYGMGHVLVDYPTKPESSTLADDRNNNYRPYFVSIEPPDLIGWRIAVAGGAPKLMQIRFVDWREENDGSYGTVCLPYIRVINADGTWELHRPKNERGQGYTKVDEGRFSYPGIPLFTFYTKRKAYMFSEPPFRELAYTNVAHWQSDSDQRNILRVARTPILFIKGMSSEDLANNVVIGPFNAMHTESDEADVTFVEVQGNAIKAGKEDLKDLEERMVMLGLEPYMQRKSGDITATGRAINEAKSHSNIEAWVRLLENTLFNAFSSACTWINKELPEDFSVDVYSDFVAEMGLGGDFDNLIKARVAGEITRRTFLTELRRRGVLSEMIDIDTEIEETESEATQRLELLGNITTPED